MRRLLAVFLVFLSPLGHAVGISKHDLPQCERDCFEWWYLRGPDFFIAFEHYLYGEDKKLKIEAADFRTMKHTGATFPFKPTKLKNAMSEGPGAVMARSGTKGTFKGDKGSVAWDLKVSPVWYFSPMGDFLDSSMPTIFWDVTKAVARISGWISFDGARREIDQAIGYEDHDWGRNFPMWWTWIQANEFENCKFPTAVVAGGGRARHEFLPTPPELSLGASYLDEKGKPVELTFTSLQGHPVEFDMTFPKFVAAGEDMEGHRIELTATAPESSFVDIPFAQMKEPTPFHDYESLKGIVSFRVMTKAGATWKTVADCRSLPTAGVEFGTVSQSRDFAPVSFRTKAGSTTASGRP